MTRNHSDGATPKPKHLSRRQIIKLAVTAGLLAGCRSLESTISPTNPPATSVAVTSAPAANAAARATPSAAPTSTLTAAPTTTPSRLPTSTRTAVPTTTPTSPPTTTPTSPPTGTVADTPTAQPTRSSTTTPTAAPIVETGRVVHTRHAGVWDGATLVPLTLGQMLDASLMALTGVNDASTAWAARFDPAERVAIKVNVIRGSDFQTHVPLVLAVAERLQSIGLPADHIVIFDRSTDELLKAGYPVNRDGPGLRCYGTDNDYAPGWTMMDTEVRLSQVLLDCDAVINIPILKQHGIAGISFAMKNHYGTFDKPGSFHGGRIARGLAELNALPPIRERTRLIIGDLLAISTRNWSAGVVGDSILMSFDPVAHDAVGLQKYRDTMTSEGLNSESATHLASGWLASGAELDLGTNDPDSINLMEQDIE